MSLFIKVNEKNIVSIRPIIYYYKEKEIRLYLEKES